MALVFYSLVLDPEPWQAAFAELMPDLDVRVWPEIGDPAEVEVMLAWRPPRGALADMPNLRFLQAFGAGVDQLLADPTIPADLPIARIVDENQTAGMRDYVLAMVLKYHRRLDVYARQQSAAVWNRLPHVDPGERRVAIMGLGELGIAAARTLAMLGFDVAGWSRTPKLIDGVKTYAGAEGWETFLAHADILVCLLPLTPETEGILNAKTFAALPVGAAVINAGRGGHIVLPDLVAALDSGHLCGATLDVFEHEPLKPDDPIWRYPKLDITPHIATISTARTSAARVVENIRRVRAGQSPLNLINRARGY